MVGNILANLLFLHHDQQGRTRLIVDLSHRGIARYSPQDIPATRSPPSMPSKLPATSTTAMAEFIGWRSTIARHRPPDGRLRPQRRDHGRHWPDAG